MMKFKEVKKILIVGGYSDSTIKTYITCLKSFKNYFYKIEIDQLAKDDIIEYLFYLIKNNYSKSSQNQHINAIKFYFEKCLGKKREYYLIDRPRKEKKLPNILSKKEIQLLFNSTYNLKHLTILAVIYSCGLRVSELINIKISDIDNNRMVIYIRKAKGNKDRQVQLTNQLLELLRKYYKKHLPVNYLIVGQNGGKYSTTSIQKIIKNSSLKAGIHKKVSPHTLRHSFATQQIFEIIKQKKILVM